MKKQIIITCIEEETKVEILGFIPNRDIPSINPPSKVPILNNVLIGKKDISKGREEIIITCQRVNSISQFLKRT